VGEILDAAALARNVAATEPTIKTNAASVAARGRALHALAEELKEATVQGRYATVAELEAMFRKAYATLPQVEQPKAPARAAA
jgi:hypothetical protein